jgi:hypothetical protein
MRSRFFEGDPNSLQYELQTRNAHKEAATDGLLVCVFKPKAHLAQAME